MSGALSASARGSAYAALPRVLSLVLALGLSGMIFAYPKGLAHASHGMLSLVMLGVSAGFVHGVGFVPENRFLRFLFGPWSAWILMGIGPWLLLRS